jgi:hypothetical protein
MCIKDYETEIEGQDPVRDVELLEKKYFGLNNNFEKLRKEISIA